MVRDNFSLNVKRKLKDRVGNFCSKPECRIITSGPSDDSTKSVNNIGVAAHICAAASGGPRYDPNMSSEERKSIDNGIWLCANCAGMIDRDVKKYPIELLYEWKDEAEKHAKKMLGKKPPDERDTINTLKAALNGETTEYISSAIDNVHKATIESLEKLDPRFKVFTEYINGRTAIAVSPKNQSVDFSINIKDEYIKEFHEKNQKLIEHGETLVIDSKAISFEGSKLLNKMVDNQSSPSYISKVKQDARIKLWIVDPDTKQMFQFDDILGDVKSGTKSFSFVGFACNKMLKLDMQMSFDMTINKLQMPLSLEVWNGVDLQNLPYFEKLYNLFVRYSEGWDMFISLEINGFPALENAQIKIPNENVEIRSGTFRYINSCKVIAESLKKNIVFKSNVEDYAGEVQHLVYLANLIEDSNQRKGVSTSLIVDHECRNVEKIIKIKTPVLINLPISEEKIQLFGVHINFPKGNIMLSAALPNICEDIEILKSGDVIEVEWIPQEDSDISFNYD